MNLSPINEGTFLICMALAIASGALLGFALGYGLKEQAHSKEIKAVMRIAKRISETNREAAKKEGVPKDPAFLTQEDWERKAAKPRRPAKWGAC